MPTCPRCTNTCFQAKQGSSLGVESNQGTLTGQRLPSYTNLHRVPAAGLDCKTDLATASCCKSVAPAKQIQHFKLANLPLQICQSPTSLGLKAPRAGQTTTHWPKAAQLHHAQASNCRSWLQNRSGHCKMLQPLPTSPCSNTALSSKSNTLNLPTCPCCRHCKFPTCCKQICPNLPKVKTASLGVKSNQEQLAPEAAQLPQSAQLPT